MTLSNTLRLGTACLTIFFITSCGSDNTNRFEPDTKQAEQAAPLSTMSTAEAFSVTYDEPEGWSKSTKK